MVSNSSLLVGSVSKMPFVLELGELPGSGASVRKDKKLTVNVRYGQVDVIGFILDHERDCSICYVYNVGSALIRLSCSPS